MGETVATAMTALRKPLLQSSLMQKRRKQIFLKPLPVRRGERCSAAKSDYKNKKKCCGGINATSNEK